MIDEKAGKKLFKRGREVLDFAEKLGMGSKKYEIVRL
jgi:uncharacterized Fe-S center protein